MVNKIPRTFTYIYMSNYVMHICTTAYLYYCIFVLLHICTTRIIYMYLQRQVTNVYFSTSNCTYIFTYINYACIHIYS